MFIELRTSLSFWSTSTLKSLYERPTVITSLFLELIANSDCDLSNWESKSLLIPSKYVCISSTEAIESLLSCFLSSKVSSITTVKSFWFKFYSSPSRIDSFFASSTIPTDSESFGPSWESKSPLCSALLNSLNICSVPSLVGLYLEEECLLMCFGCNAFDWFFFDFIDCLYYEFILAIWLSLLLSMASNYCLRSSPLTNDFTMRAQMKGKYRKRAKCLLTFPTTFPYFKDSWSYYENSII